MTDANKWQIVLTATVVPGPRQHSLVTRDPEVRLEQYMHAVKWWQKSAEAAGVALAVIENSGNDNLFHDLDCVRAGTVQVIPGVRCDSQVAARGKGMGEANILAQAADLFSDRELIIKCTGRLIVRNWQAVIRRGNRLKPQRVLVDWNLDLSAADTRFLAAPPAALGDFADYALAVVNDHTGHHLEHAMAEWLVREYSRGNRAALFERTPLFVGRSASTGTNYSIMRGTFRSVLENLLDARILRTVSGLA